VAKLADAPDLGSGGATHGGSSPPFRTNRDFPRENHCTRDTAEEPMEEFESRIPQTVGVLEPVGKNLMQNGAPDQPCRLQRRQ
jgi:hypothetical protein